MRNIKTTLLSLTVILIIAGCSNPAKIPTAAESVAVHSAGWLDPNSADFHADKVVGPNSEIAQCRQCHRDSQPGSHPS